MIVRWDLWKSDQFVSERKEPCTRVTPRGMDSRARHRSAFTDVRSHNRRRLSHTTALQAVVKNFFVWIGLFLFLHLSSVVLRLRLQSTLWGVR